MKKAATIVSIISMCVAVTVLLAACSSSNQKWVESLVKVIESDDAAKAAEQVGQMLDERQNYDLNEDTGWSFFADGMLGPTPLQAACEQGNFDIVRQLVEHGADVNYVGGNGDGPPLNCAVTADQSKDRIKIITFLLDKGADANKKVDYGVSPGLPVETAALFGTAIEKKGLDYYSEEKAAESLKLVKLLLEQTEITEKNKDAIYGNMLCNAVYSGNEQLVHYLVEEVAVDINTKDECDMSPLFYCYNDPEKKGFPKKAIFDYLVEKGIDLFYVDEEGETAYDYIHGYIKDEEAASWLKKAMEDAGKQSR